jgi:tRNA nucleotidyltransferase (CCA-adding enzyme)
MADNIAPSTATNTPASIEVILTHEHTDFDALASLLAASLLYPTAIPILPRQLNRNVRNFLALYRNQFPFITYKDLPRHPIQRTIVVDSRAVNWVKGMDNTTPHLIIDHHVNDEPLPPHYQLWHEPVGANTTLLVEKLAENNVTLSPLHATLLALGIHEDTGSLTYASTTYGDAKALAWVMEPEHKVNLDVLNQFLSHPLTEAQRDLLDTLVSQSEFTVVGGHTVVISSAEAEGFNEELSALATRLRDFHEADALFLVVDLGDIIQVVARSITDEINVGVIATELGGGGHPRAAAAPLHNAGSTHEVSQRIIELLQRHSNAAITVQNIMSVGRPQTLTPDMSIEDAAHLMRRYGHEGFPVLRPLPGGGEELLGVLTRREADRALNHDLGKQPVSRFMRVGQITVRPDTPVTILRQLMIDSHWGQIPVVDEQNHIIGIVTRTDLIKLWDEAALPSRNAQAIANKLKASLHPVQHALLQLIGEEVSVLNYTVYIVGGFVRDLLLNGRFLDMATQDMDIVIEGNAIAFAQRMQSLYGGRVVPHKRFNTAKWLLNDADYPVQAEKLLADLEPNDAIGEMLEELIDKLPAHLDFVTARTEFYTAPTVLPTVEDSSIKLDLHRRDFTINTLALCLNPGRWGELLDFYGGVNDLNQGIIRILHSLSFVDDPTRILRAVRYEQRFGFTIEARTLELLQNAIELLDRVTPARIRHELERILQEEHPENALARLQELRILARLDPMLHFDERMSEAFAALRIAREQAPSNALLRTEPIDRLYWGVLVAQLPASVHVLLTKRLGLRSETQELMRGLARLHHALPELTTLDLPPSRIVAILDPIDPVALTLVPVIYADQAQLLSYVEQYQTTWSHVHSELDGHDLAALGVPRGPVYGEILSALRAAKLDGTILTRAQEEEFVRNFLHQG